jgi:hypothetical protein
MVGGTIFHRGMIQREISRVLVLNLSGKANGCSKHPQEIFVLDSAFALIEGQPPVVSSSCTSSAGRVTESLSLTNDQMHRWRWAAGKADRTMQHDAPRVLNTSANLESQGSSNTIVGRGLAHPTLGPSRTSHFAIFEG